MKGFFKNVKKNDFPSNGFILVDSLGGEIKIEPNSYLNFNVGREKFKSISDKSGKNRFMKSLVSGEKVNLFSHSYTFGVNVPGEGYQSGFNSDYYMQRGNAIFFVRIKDVFKRPERYFPGNQKLIDKIKRTKKNMPELVLWSLVYDGQIELEDLP
ncbi:unnamed protein product [Ectocarpus sp. 12 AP-2014]